MLATLFSLLKMIWPFIKEAVLEGGTVRNWILKNRMTTAFIVMLAAMFVSMLVMADLVIKGRGEILTLKAKETELIHRYNGLAGRYNALRKERLTCSSSLDVASTRLNRLRLLVADSCPDDSSAYKTLVAGLEALDYQVVTETKRWCSVVTAEDLAVEAIRQRYIRECG